MITELGGRGRPPQARRHAPLGVVIRYRKYMGDGARQFCSECGRPYSGEDLVRFGDAAVCAECKPNYVQRLREGVSTSTSSVYGGFWRRFLAVVIDVILLWIVLLPLRWVITVADGSAAVGNYAVNPFSAMWTAFWGWGTLVAYTVEIIYYVYFISQKGATLGKMVVGVKVVTATGEPVSVGRALGRYFAKYLSGFILCIGYIMAAFDEQKRALHDHICNTRVIRD